MKKRPKPAKRKFAKVCRYVHQKRLYPARRWRLKADSNLVVEVCLARTQRQMQDETRRLDGAPKGEFADASGVCRYWFSRVTREHRSVTKQGRLVSRIYLNAADIRRKPSEIIAHECTHAGMAVARIRKADVYESGRGEEVLAYAVGRLVAQVNRVCYASNVFRHP